MYNNNPNNYGGNPYQAPESRNYYQNFYNMFGEYNPIADKEATELRKYGTRAGAFILFALVMQYAGIIALRASGLAELYTSSADYMNGIGVFFQFFYLFVPFIVAFIISSKSDKEKILIYGKPSSGPLYLFAIFAGLLVCSAANFAGTVLVSFFSATGVDFISGMEDNPVPDNIMGYILMTVNVAVMPALLEEFAFRGVILQPLRKYGDKFAIVVSSVVFALMHGNMVQIPFAFIVGLALGYFCIATDSIWTSATIHFLNNFSSVIVSIYYEKYPEANSLPYIIISAATVFLGIIALILFVKNKEYKLVKSSSQLAASTKRGLYLCTPTITAVVIYFAYTTLQLQYTNSLLGILVLLALNALICVYFVKNILVIRRDKRLANTSSYGVSLVFIVIWAAIGTFLIVFSSIASIAGSTMVN